MTAKDDDAVRLSAISDVRVEGEGEGEGEGKNAKDARRDARRKAPKKSAMKKSTFTLKPTSTFLRRKEMAEDSALYVKPVSDVETTSVVRGAWKTLVLILTLLVLGTITAVTAQGLADMNVIFGDTLDKKQIDILNRVVDSAIPPLVFMFGTLIVLILLALNRLFNWWPRWGIIRRFAGLPYQQQHSSSHSFIHSFEKKLLRRVFTEAHHERYANGCTMIYVLKQNPLR